MMNIGKHKLIHVSNLLYNQPYQVWANLDSKIMRYLTKKMRNLHKAHNHTCYNQPKHSFLHNYRTNRAETPQMGLTLILVKASSTMFQLKKEHCFRNNFNLGVIITPWGPK